MKFYRLYKFLGWIIIGVAALLLLLPQIVPHFTPDQTVLRSWVAKQIPYPISVETIQLNWERFSPIVQLSDVEIFTQDNQPALHVQKMKLLLDPWRCIFGRIQLEEVIIEGANVGLEYEKGHLSISGLPEFEWDLNAKSVPGIPFVKQLVIQKSNIHLMLGEDRSLPLTAGRLWIEAKESIRIRGAATVVGLTPAFLSFSIDIPILRSQEASIYCHWYGGELNQFARFFPKSFPVNFEKGRLSMQAWVRLREKQEMDIIAKMQLQDALMTTKTEETLAFQTIQGRIHAHRQDQQWMVEGSNWDIVEQQDEQSFVPRDNARDLGFRVLTRPCNQSQCWELTTHQINVQQWLGWLEKLAIFPQPQWIKDLQPRGWLEYFNLAAMLSEKGWSIQEAEGVFTGAQIKPANSYPGIVSLSGALVFADQKGKLLLQSDKMHFSYPKFFSTAFVVSEVSCLADWHMEGDKVFLRAQSLQAYINDALVHGQGTLRFADQGLPEVDLFLQADKFSTKKALALLPRHVMDKELVKWLEKAIGQGEVVSPTLVLRGDLAKFPFDQQEGVFEVAANVRGATLNYDPKWPKLTDLDADLLFHNRAMVITAHQGKMSGGQLAKAQAIISDLSVPLPILNVEAKVSSTLPVGAEVVKNSPLNHLAKTLAPFTFQGDMDLSLGLAIPLSSHHLNEVKVRGLLEVMDASVKMPEWNVDISHLQGNVSFTENGIHSEELKGEWFSQLAQFQISSPGDQELHIKAEGNIALAKLQDWLKIKPVKQILGETDYSARLMLSSQQTHLFVTSSLKGVTIEAPPPFAKSAASLRPLEFKLNRDPNALMRVAAKLGDEVNLAVSLDPHHSPYQIKGGHLHFGDKQVAKFREDHIFLIDGEITELDSEVWKPFLHELKAWSPATAGAAQPGIEPIVELKIGSLKLLGTDFTNTHLEAQWESPNHLWHVNFDGPSLKGQIKLPHDSHLPLIIDLQKLALITNQPLNDIFTSKKPFERPVDVKINELLLDKKKFYALTARMEPSLNGVTIPSLKAKMKNTEVSLKGTWDYLVKEKTVKAQGNITTRNITDTLEALGIKSSLQGAQGSIGFNLQWNGTPAKWDIPSLTGQADFVLTQGYIYGVNPGLGRVLNLLSLDNVRRRLNLDFNDLTKNGFAFDELTGKLQLGKGKISSNKILLQGPSAKIEAFGQADLVNQTLKGELIVMPNVTGSLPVAAAIAAGNPAVGAAVWVVDKMLGNKIQEIHRFKYRVQGTWQAPILQEVSLTPNKGVQQ